MVNVTLIHEVSLRFFYITVFDIVEKTNGTIYMETDVLKDECMEQIKEGRRILSSNQSKVNAK